MSDGLKLQKRASLVGLEQQVIAYLKNVPPEVLGVESCSPVEILAMTAGTYNLNFHVAVRSKRFVFRVNVQQQSGLSDQVNYEFQVMKFLEPFDLSARVFLCDNTKSHFDYDILIEEYLEGPWVPLTQAEMPAVAALLVRLHSLNPCSLNLITWSDPLMDTIRLVEADLAEYKSKKSADAQVIALTERFLSIIAPRVQEKQGWFVPNALNHTDVAIDNFVKTTAGLKLIDWEKPRFDDYTYDVCCFLAEPAQLWCTPQPLSREGRETFLQEYIRLSGMEAERFLEKVRVREPLVALHWIYWGMNRMCDLKDQTTVSALQQVHEERVSRWERIADRRLIEKLIDDL